MDMSQQCTLAAQKDNYLGLHQKKCDQQVEGRGSAPLLRSHETPPGALHPALWFPVQERHEPVRVGPEEGHKNGLRTGTPLLWRKAEKVGVVQPGEEKAAGRCYCGLPILKRGLQERQRKTFTRAHSDGTRGDLFKLKEVRFRLDIMVKFFTMRVVWHWNRLPRGVVDAPSLEVFKLGLGGALSIISSI